MSDKKESRTLGELSAYERWELPTLDDSNTPARSRSAVVNKAVKPLTAEDLEKIHQEAYQAGFNEGKVAGHEQGLQEGVVAGTRTGHEEGLQQGLAAGKTKINQEVEHLRKLMSELVEPINEQRKQVELATLNVALALARTIIHRELKLDSSSIQSALSNIYQTLPKMDSGLILSINPADQIHLDRALETVESSIELKQDPKITVGGFLLETSNQLIDYTIEKRFQKVVHEMLLNAIQLESDSVPIETSTTIKELSDYPAELLEKADLDTEIKGETLKDDDASSLAKVKDGSDASLPESTTSIEEKVEQDQASPGEANE